MCLFSCFFTLRMAYNDVADFSMKPNVPVENSKFPVRARLTSAARKGSQSNVFIAYKRVPRRLMERFESWV